jgi:hypothetical protein
MNPIAPRPIGATMDAGLTGSPPVPQRQRVAEARTEDDGSGFVATPW